MATIAARMTLEQFLTLPELKPALEYEDGEVTRKMSPKGQHSVLQTYLSSEINRLVVPRKLGMALTELRATFAGMSRVPDIAVYRWNRIPLDDTGRVANDFVVPPDIAIEIMSPGQRVNRVMRRLLTYVAAGVSAAVSIDPADESVIAVRRGVEPLALRTGDTLDLSDLIAGLRLDVASAFAALRIDG